MTNKRNSVLPAGQYLRDDFPRFGLPKYTHRFPGEVMRIQLQITGDELDTFDISGELSQLPRVKQIADFHCVTTWSTSGLEWSGYRFSDFYKVFVEPYLVKKQAGKHVVFRAQDGYRALMQLEDLMQPDVILADTLNGVSLGIAHGAPLRLVAPAHYGYKNVKHLSRIEFRNSAKHYRSPSLKFMEHPRARVNHEERGRWFPGWLLRYLYRPLVASTVVQYQKALDAHTEKSEKI